ncbi:SDR family oxidoreductase [Alkalihalobacillus sp. AL-G]|uniref:SDR family oxidoreductase n=1 Tax=Alkalihalobacillus sp. AL-G TaxID=2926399 RepID=UPI00272DB36B|nr:SDR family oxidoreductase [Alkalihalobacillus sp. AL-G]WLD94219.1 SDR family oxidoreductase [Alkalihalobacillus sp. AL-G]
MANRKVALVTGASREKGIGAGVCRRLAQSGVDVFFIYWTNYDQLMEWGVQEDEPERLADEITSMGVRCEHAQWDLSDALRLPALIERVTESLGYPDMLINNACYSVDDDVESITAESLDAHYQINVRATTLLTVAFARGFSKGSGGRVVSLTSGQSQDPMSDEISYAVTKGTVETLTKTLAPPLAKKGITINAVNPGPNDTGWMTDDLKEALLPRFPMGRIGKPDDVAKLIQFLSSEEAEWVTGQIIHSEGGFLRS